MPTVGVGPELPRAEGARTHHSPRDTVTASISSVLMVESFGARSLFGNPPWSVSVKKARSSPHASSSARSRAGLPRYSSTGSGGSPQLPPRRPTISGARGQVSESYSTAYETAP
jgi:hypothetical protein